MYNFTVSEVLDQAWALTKKHGLLLALILLVISLVEGAFTSVDSAQVDALTKNLQSGGDINAFYREYSTVMRRAPSQRPGMMQRQRPMLTMML